MFYCLVGHSFGLLDLFCLLDHLFVLLEHQLNINWALVRWTIDPKREDTSDRMQLTTHLKVGSTGVPSLWFILVLGIVLLSSEEARGHAPPRPLYYGHRIESREPFKHIPSALVFGVNSAPVRNRLYDVIPTCGQLRNMWKSSLKDIIQDNNNNNNLNNNFLESNEIPVILNNPYYLAFLSGLQRSRPHFGKILSEKPNSATQPSVSDNRPTHHSPKAHISIGSKQMSVRDDDLLAPIPGQFMDKPIDMVFGHLVTSPDEAKATRHSADGKHGRFGDFAANEPTDDQSDPKQTDNSISPLSNERLKQSPSVRQRNAGNELSAAQDFFKSGVWHDQPVIPSVSFHQVH